jgi:uncharacterized protein YhjY with autotransporter beta-barrel domain
VKIPILRFTVGVRSAVLAGQFLAMAAFAQSTIGPGSVTGPISVPFVYASPATIEPETTITVPSTSSGNVLDVTGAGTLVTTVGPVTMINDSSGFGADVNYAADVNLNNTTIQTQGSFGVGILVGGADINGAATATLTNVDITTTGPLGIGLDGTRMGTVVDYNGGKITTSGDTSLGVYSDTGGRVNLSNVVINTSGTDAIGVVAETLHIVPDQGLLIPGGGTISISGGSITTTGMNAIGVLASGTEASITLNGATISTGDAIAVAAMPLKVAVPAFDYAAAADTGGVVILDHTTAKAGSGNSGALVQDGGQLTIQNNSSLEGGSDGVTLTNSSGNTDANAVVVNNSTITADAGDAFKAEGAVGTITISNVNNTIHASTGNLLVADSASTVDLNIVDNSIVTGVIEGAHNLTIDPSTWITPNNSFITGNLTLLGNLIINSVAKFAATGQASVLTIGGNLIMGSGSTTSLGIGGLLRTQYDRLVVGGNAAVSGELVVSSLGGFHPSPGEAFGILRTSGTTSGNWGSLDETQFNTLPGTPRGQLIEVVGPNGIDLVYAKSTTPPATGPEPPIIETEPEPLPPVQEVDQLVDPTAEELTSLYEISFSDANMQRFILGDRMFQIQQGAMGLVSPITPVSPPPPTGKELEGKGVEGKAPPPAPPPSPTYRWGVWANGYGDFVHIDGTSIANGYGFVTGGMSAGVDYLITDHFAVGLFGGYSHNWVNFTPSGSADMNTGRGGVYATYFQQGWWINAAAWAGYNSFSTSRQAVAGTANGSSNGYEVSTFGDAGYDFHCGDLAFGPTVSMQYTTAHISGFGETGSLVPLNIHGDSQDSLRTDVGGQAYYKFHLGNIPVIPNLRLAWEHEYFYSNLPITATAPALDGATGTFYGPDEGHDSMIINANIAVQWTPRIWTTIGYDGQVARDHYNANAVSGTFSFSF